MNHTIITLNKYFSFIGDSEQLLTKLLKVPKQFDIDKFINKSEYERLLKYAKKLNKDKIYYIMLVLANTGIRVSELKFLTVEDLGKSSILVNNKGRIRNIYLPKDLVKDLKGYCKAKDIKSGIIFHGKSKYTMIDTSYLWREMKYIAGQAKVKKSKVHAHSFRHLFAKTYMEINNNAINLADILGHSSLETTRIYTRNSAKEHAEQISKLGLY